MNKYDFLIVGAGFAGITCAQQLAENGYSVLIIDKRSHIGGNAFDKYDEYGVLIHPYGPHIFHTNSKAIFEYLSRFTEWRFYEHEVLAEVEGDFYPIPINKITINKLYGLNLKTDLEVEEFLKNVSIDRKPIRTSEDVVLSTVGKDLCEKFFSGYTQKQWGMSLSELSASVCSRIPTRTNSDTRYFTDKYQFMPANGYTKLFEKMLNNNNIEVILDTDLESVRNKASWNKLVYTGPIDSYFNYEFGKLPYRSLKFTHTHFKNIDKSQIVGTINYPNTNEFTRITEFKHLTGQNCKGTSLVYEYPESEGDPFYPIPNELNNNTYKKYLDLTENIKNVYFVGRLAEYKYYNMDQVVASALKLTKDILISKE